jgi:radical SAM-linked protein
MDTGREQLLQAWDEALASAPDPMLEHLIRDLDREGLAEEAWARLRRAPGARQAAWAPWRKRLEVRAAVARERRQQREQLDSDRCLLRIRYARGGALRDAHPGVFHAAFVQVLRAAGLDLAMSLEKSPRPLVAMGHPLPLGAEGLSEWADATLNRAPSEGWLEAANTAAPEGLRLLEGLVLPPYAQGALDLSVRSRWFWPCPEAARREAEARVGDFLRAAVFEIEKGGKVGGQKTVKRVDIRPLVESMAWEEGGLAFATAIRHGEALNPAKLLAGILGPGVPEIRGLLRRGVDLAPDPRLAQQDRFAPKLKNLYEDAVLLGQGGNITLVDEEDDEPTVLGGG